MSAELGDDDSDVSWSDPNQQEDENPDDEDNISESSEPAENEERYRQPEHTHPYIDRRIQKYIDFSEGLTPRRSSRNTFTDDSNPEMLEIDPTSSSLVPIFSTITSPSIRAVDALRSARTTLVDAPPDENLSPVLEKEIFEKPTLPADVNTSRFGRPAFYRQTTERSSNSSNARSNFQSNGNSNSDFDNTEMTSLLSANRSTSRSTSANLGDSYSSSYGQNYVDKSVTIAATSNAFFLPPSNQELFPVTIDANEGKKKDPKPENDSCLQDCMTKTSMESILTGAMGSILFVLFHIVFCLAQAASIHRPFSGKPVLGVMVRQAAVGPLIAGPLFVYLLNGDFAAVYPSVDCFPAPFFVEMAAIVDKVLVDDGLEDDDLTFLTTFGVLSFIALFSTGLLLLIGTKVKIVNLSAYLPYPVMCGFFASVGVLMWTLAFTVDTGQNVWHVLFGGDAHMILYCMKHHVGSLAAGAVIVTLGKRNRGLVPILSLLPIPLVYFAMFLTGTTLKEAQSSGWFWSQDDFQVKVSWNNVDTITWEPPLPFGIIAGIMQGKVHIPAIVAGLPTVISMALIYFIRCSVHAPALRKNSNSLLKWKEEQATSNDSDKRRSSVAVGDDDFFWEDINDTDSNHQSAVTNTSLSMSDIFWTYGKLICVNGLSGGFACLPTVSVAGTLFKIGVVGAIPQYGSMILLAVFYFTEFGIVSYLPKITFSSMLFVSSIEMTESWLLTSYKKTAVKSEWIVTPIIVIFTFLVGSLQSVALGLALSTFIFVGTLNKRGVVKFIANGLTVHSITERNAEDALWLDQHGDQIQLLVLQSYIFFGNANSCLAYVNSMFEDVPESVAKPLFFPLPPLPKYLIIDMTMVSGIDTSSIDVFGEIIQLCFRHKCQVYMAGLTLSFKQSLALGGVKPSHDKNAANSTLRFLPEMESALCKAEDGLLKNMSQLEQKEMRRSRIRANSTADDGFLYALKEIDNQVSWIKNRRACQNLELH